MQTGPKGTAHYVRMAQELRAGGKIKATLCEHVGADKASGVQREVQQ